MPRRRRTDLAGFPLHVVQRGNNRGPCFFSDRDRRTYLRWLKDYSAEFAVAIHAWVLMTNHVHLFLSALVPIPRINRSVRAFTAREENLILGRTGQFWQHESYDHWSRDLRQSERVIAYIEENPVKAGLAKRAEDYKWSSAYGLR